MASVKSYAAMQDLSRVPPGPWVAFHPLRQGWSVAAPWSGAWARYDPTGHFVEVSLYADVNGATVTDETLIGVMPTYDDDPRFPPKGNLLRPPQVSRLGASTNVTQSNNPARLHFYTNGEIRCYGISGSATWVSCHDGRHYSMYQM